MDAVRVARRRENARRCRSGRFRRNWIEGCEETPPARLARDSRLARVVVVVTIDLAVGRARGAALVNALNAAGGDAAVGVRDLYAALSVEGDVHEVEKVSVVRRAVADDRAGVAYRAELHGVVRRRVNGRPRLAAVVCGCDVEMPDGLKVFGVLVVAAGGRAEEGVGRAVVVARNDFG